MTIRFMQNIFPSRFEVTVAVILLALGAPAVAADCFDYGTAVRVESSLALDARFMASHDDLVYLSSGSIIDIATPGAPAEIGSFELPDGEVRGMRVDGGRLHVIATASGGGTFNGVAVYDLAMPAAPVRLPLVETPGIATHLRVDGDRVFVRNDEGLVVIVDFAAPDAPVTRGSFGRGWLDAFDVAGDFAYAANRTVDGLTVVSLSNLDWPNTLGSHSWTGIEDVRYVYGLLHVLRNNSYWAYDMSDHHAPVLLRQLPELDRVVVMEGDRAYGLGLPFEAWDMTDPAAPAPLASIDLVVQSGFLAGDRLIAGVSGDFVEIDTVGGMAPAAVRNDHVMGPPTGTGAWDGHLYVLQREGLDVFAAAGAVPVRIGGCQLLGDNTGHAVAQDHLFYLGRGQSAGTTTLHAVSLVDPAAPAPVAEVQIDGLLQGLAPYGSLLYASAGGDLVVIDVSDPAAPAEASRVQGRGFDYPFAIVAGALASSSYGELKFFDLSTPAAPALTVAHPLGYLATAMAAAGDRLYLLDGTGLEIWSVPSPAAASRQSGLTVPGTLHALAVAGDHVVVEGHSLHLVDATDPASPAFAGLLPYVTDRVEHLAVAGGALHFALYRSPDAGLLYTAPLPCGDAPPYRDVLVDIKPGSDLNPVNCKPSRGVLPVAVLTTDDFDALDIDHTTVRFGPGQAPEAHENKHGVKRHEEDVNGDGRKDLLFHFEVPAIGLECDASSLELVGETWDGTEVRGWDKVTIVGTRPADKLGATVTAARPSLVPNPFNPKTEVRFRLERPGRVTVGVYDVAGRRVAVLADGEMPSGEHGLVWLGRDEAGRDAPSGVYFVRVEGPGVSETLRAALLR